MKKSRGFTLIELLIVTVVIATLMAIVFRLGVSKYIIPKDYIRELSFIIKDRHQFRTFGKRKSLESHNTFPSKIL